MKMGIFFGNLFWRILLILWGASLILKSVGVSLPLAKIFFALIIILFGIRLLVGGSWKCKSGISSVHIKGGRGEYTSVFSNQEIDLMHVKPGDKPIEINAVFGSARVILPSDVAFDVHPTTVFGATSTPKQSHTGFGENHQVFNDSVSGERVTIESNAVFGRIEFLVKPSDRFKAEADSTETEAPEF